MPFSPTDAAFEGFRITRRHPGGVLAWAGVMLGANLLSGPVLSAVLRVDSAAYDAAVAAAESGKPHLPPGFMAVAILSSIIQIIAPAVVNTSVLRTLLRPERRVTLRFGRDELRIIGLFLAFIVVCSVATIATTIVLTVAGMPLNVPTIWLMSIVSAMVLYIPFSLAGPATVAEHHLRFFSSWKMTRPWFWPLVGSELLGVALCAVVAVLAMIVSYSIGSAAILASGGNPLTDFPAAVKFDGSSLAKALAVGPLLWIGFQSVLYALLLVIVIGPPVELYRHLTNDAVHNSPD